MSKITDISTFPHPAPFKDALGRDASTVPLLRGGRCLILAEDLERLSKRPDFTRVWRVNNDRATKREGKPLPYARFLGSGSKQVHRAIVEEKLRANRIRFPKGFEVACKSQDRCNLLPENWKLRPRGENKYWVDACIAFGPAFDFKTGFDMPEPDTEQNSTASAS